MVQVRQWRAWTPQQEERYTAAHVLLNDIIAAYSSLIGRAAGESAERLRAERLAFIRERTALTVHQEAEVERVLCEYPAVLRRVEGGVV